MINDSEIWRGAIGGDTLHDMNLSGVLLLDFRFLSKCVNEHNAGTKGCSLAYLAL